MFSSFTFAGEQPLKRKRKDVPPDWIPSLRRCPRKFKKSHREAGTKARSERNEENRKEQKEKTRREENRREEKKRGEERREKDSLCESSCRRYE